MKSLSRASLYISFLLILIVCAVTFWACEGAGALYPKLPPDTRLSNIPPDSILAASPRLALSWIGDDADGYVVAYKYRWSFRLTAADTFQERRWTTLLNFPVTGLALIILGDETVAPKVYKYFSTLPREGLDPAKLAAFFAGDTLLIEGVPVYASNPDGQRYPVHSNPSSGTFIFDSPDFINPHIFEIAAIDNDGLVDPTPATLFFSTPQASPPSTEIVSSPVDSVFALDYTTDTFRGIPFEFRGIDKNSRTLEYQWVIDKEIWLATTGRIPWTEFSSSTHALVTAADFPDRFAIHHTFYVRAKNEFGAIDTLGWFLRTGQTDTVFARVGFNSIYPLFKRSGYAPRTLLINNSYDFDTLAVDPQRPNYAMLEQYYRDIYGALGKTEGVDYDIWRVKEKKFPGPGTLSRYSKVHFFGDVVNYDNFKWSKTAGTELSLSVGSEGIVTAYCNIGGKLIMNGWDMTRADQIPQVPDFWHNILHISLQFSVGGGPDVTEYIGATAEAGTGYPDMMIDQSRLDTVFHGGLNYSWTYQLSGFGEILYRYNAKTLPSPFFPPPNGLPVGVRYLGITYDVFFLSFPLYYSDKTAATELLRKINLDFDTPR